MRFPTRFTSPAILFALAVLSLASVAAAALPLRDPRSQGPYTTLGSEEFSMTGPATNGSYTTTVFYPGNGDQLDKSGAPYPVVVFNHGMSSSRETLYSYGRLLASWGYVVMHPHRPLAGLNKEHSQTRDDLIAILTRVLDENSRRNSRYYQALDLSRVGACGHSQGGEYSFLMAQADPRIKVAVGLDPVDTVFVVSPAINGMANLSIPFLVLGTDQQGGACNNVNQNYNHFYDKGHAPKMKVTMVGGDHCSLMGESLHITICATLCGGRGANSARQNEIFERMTVAWFHRWLLGETQWETYLWGPEAQAEVPRGPIVITHELGGGMTPTPVPTTPAVTPTPTPTATVSAPTATPSPTAVPWLGVDIDANLDPSYLLTVGIRVANNTSVGYQASLYAAVEVAGRFYFVPNYTEQAVPLVGALDLTPPIDTGFVEYQRVPLGVPLPLTVTWYAAILNNADGSLLGELASDVMTP